MDSIPGFIKIIQEETTNFDFLYRLDERLSMPEEEYFDYTGVPFGKFYGPQFRFGCGSLCNPKTIIVHIDDITQDKLLMVVKKSADKDGREFWHIEIETLPHKDSEYAGRDGAFRPRSWCMKTGEMVHAFRGHGAWCMTSI